MSGEENKTILRQLVDVVFNQRNSAAINNFVADAALNHFKPALPPLVLYVAFPDLHLTIEDMIAEANTIVVRWTMRGTHTGPVMDFPPSGRQVTGERIDIFRIAGSKIVSAWDDLDDFGLLRQIGIDKTVEVPVSIYDEPVLDVKEIQGNILAGFNKDYQTLYFLEITDVTHYKSWLRRTTPMIANLEEVLAFNQLFKALVNRRGMEIHPSIEATWINIAFSFQGLKKLTKDADSFTDIAFKEGMCKRSQLLGDPTTPDTEGHHSKWLVGGLHNMPDVVLIIASDHRNNVAQTAARLELSQQNGLRIILEQPGETLPAPRSSHEHFGFRDGISQPGFRGRLSSNPSSFLTPRQNPADPNQGKPGQNLVWPGEFVFGYAGQDRDHKLKPGPVVEAGPTWATNGSFLVFRRYRQDVEAFQNFVQFTADHLRQRGFPEMTAEKLGAKLLGRWASGTPLLRSPFMDTPNIAQDSCADNHFRFVHASQSIAAGNSAQCADQVFPRSPGDDFGIICPHAAHIRKAYPRDDLERFGAEGAAESHRLIRRGIPFGKPFPAEGERGLLFLSYQTSIDRQFEFVVRHWLNNPDFRDPGDGYDSIVGQNNAEVGRPRTFALSATNPDQGITKITVHLPADWTTPTGGGYFFTPSISTLKLFSE